MYDKKPSKIILVSVYVLTPEIGCLTLLRDVTWAATGGLWSNKWLTCLLPLSEGFSTESGNNADEVCSIG